MFSECMATANLHMHFTFRQMYSEHVLNPAIVWRMFTEHSTTISNALYRPSYIGPTITYKHVYSRTHTFGPASILNNLLLPTKI